MPAGLARGRKPGPLALIQSILVDTWVHPPPLSPCQKKTKALLPQMIPQASEPAILIKSVLLSQLLVAFCVLGTMENSED